jgi:Flp pilus assembly protein TadG
VTAPGRGRRRPRGDDGTVLLLVLGFTALLVLMVGVVVDVSAVVLAKRAVASAADGAAVSAAQALDTDRLYTAGLAGAVPLSAADARARAEAYRQSAALTQPGLQLVARVDGDTAVVDARRLVRLPFPLPGRAAVAVQAQARARAPVLP